MRSQLKCRGPEKIRRGKRRCGARDEMEESGGSVGARISPNPQDKPIPSLNFRGPESTTAEAIVGKRAGRLHRGSRPETMYRPHRGRHNRQRRREADSAERERGEEKGRRRRGRKRRRKRERGPTQTGPGGAGSAQLARLFATCARDAAEGLCAKGGNLLRILHPLPN